jgi:hypothetical protein
MSLKNDYLEALAGSDIDTMMDLGLKYYEALKYDSGKIADIITSDIRRFFLDPLDAKKLYFAFLEEFNKGGISWDDFCLDAPAINL